MSTSTSKTPRFYLALAAGKATAAALKLARRNGGQLPGSVAEAICPDFLARCPKPRRVVFAKQPRPICWTIFCLRAGSIW